MLHTFDMLRKKDRPTRIIAIANQKGGVGKTTSTINLGVALAEKGKSVLLVDFDPQANLSIGLGLNIDGLGDRNIYHALFEPHITLPKIVKKTSIPGLFIAPSTLDLTAAELQLFQRDNRERALFDILDPHKRRFDYILIDCPPSLGLLTLNALVAANEIIVPLQCAYWAMRGMRQLMDTLEKIKTSGMNPNLQLNGILLTMYNTRTLISQQVADRAREAFGDKVFKTLIKETVRFDYATVAGESILTHAKASEAAEAYRTVAKEVDRG